MDEAQIEAASAQAMALADEAAMTLAANEINTYVANGLRKFSEAKGGQLEVRVAWDRNLVGYTVEATFRFNGYTYTGERLLRQEDIDEHAINSRAWARFLNREIELINEKLTRDLAANGITALEKRETVSGSAWFEATGKPRPRGAPTNPVYGQFHATLFGDLFVWHGDAWHQVPPDVSREQMKALAEPPPTREQQEAAIAAIRRSMEAQAARPPAPRES